MEDNGKMIDSLLEKASDYGETSLKLAKLIAVDKSSKIISAIVPHSVFLTLIVSSLLFFSLGLALWVGEILGRLYYGFFVIAFLYLLTGTVIHFFFQKWFRKYVADYFIKTVLK